MTETRYNPFTLEPEWQKRWNEKNVFKTDTSGTKPKYYVLEMFPYPSGKIHVGHARNYIVGDVIARFKRAQGYSVLHPLGWDAFGMPAENAAIKNKVHPGKWTHKNIEEMKTDLNLFGLCIDWDRELATCEPNYYKHQQAFFIDMYKKGLVYSKEAHVNWDPVDQTVLANEQVVDGKGWRSGAPVERRTMKQWFFNITRYADDLLNDLEGLTEWPEQVRTMQANWIGRSEGLTFTFDVTGPEGQYADGMKVYTTRPDTIMGVTFCSVAPEHPLAAETAKNDDSAAAFIKECQGLGTSEEAIEKAEKKGYKTPFTAKHPITGEDVPIYIANFVLMGYGTGAVMAVPAHDERDYAFAKKYDLPIKQVIEAPQGTEVEADAAYTGAGTLVNSAEFDGLDNDKAKSAVIDWFEAKNIGERTVNYRLRDWGISRQRYWGTPIPFINCDKCGTVPVPKDQLPVQLPEDVEITGHGGNPLDLHPSWKHVDCPECGGKAVRETDTMDTFVDSSWYYARYTCVDSDLPLDPEAVNHWLPVDQYIGGIEHAVLHLLYARFITKALKEVGYVNVKEPFKALLTQGMVLSPCYRDSKGEYINPLDVIAHSDGTATHKETGEKLEVLSNEKMSKSKNNGVPPKPLVETYGADTLRLFSMFCAPIERTLEWAESGVDGAWRYLGRVWGLVNEAGFSLDDYDVNKHLLIDDISDKKLKDLKRKIHKTIRKVTSDLEKMQFNTSVAACMELANALGEYRNTQDETAQLLYKEGVASLLRVLNPVAPHITEELWKQLGQTTWLVEEEWPGYDENAVKDDEITLVIQVNGKLREKLTVAADISKEDAEKEALTAVEPHIAGLTVRKTIVVPGRLVNIVAN